MSTFAVTNDYDIIPAVNYLLSNLDTSSIAGNVLTVNTTTGVVSQSGNATPFGYLYQYINLRYSNNATGTAGFDINSNNYSYFGVFNSVSSSPSSNPSAYQWFEVSPPFDAATSRTLYYSAIGGRQIVFTAANTSPGVNYVVTTPNVAIDLDLVTGSTGTDGFSIVVPNVYRRDTSTPATPTGGTYNFDTTVLTPPAGWNVDPPAGTDPLYVSQNTFQSNAGGTVSPTGAWSAARILVENGANGTPGVDGISVYNYPVFRQSATQPATPGAEGSFNFATSTGTPPTGWANAPISVTTDPIWVTTAVASNASPTGTWTASISSWSTPVQYTGEGGVDGERGFIPMAYVVTTQNPTISPGNTTANLSVAFSANRTNLVAPIGTGYAPIPGDTASFTWSANTAVNQVYTYNSSNVWATAVGQVVNGNVLVTGSINAGSLNANDVYALNLSGGNVTVGTYSGLGYWFQAATGNAYLAGNLQIGNGVIIGNNLTVGANANIGGNLNIGNTATIGNSATIGNLLTVGANANIGANLIVGTNANIGNSLSIGNLLTVGTNANIGANLTVGANANIGNSLTVGNLLTVGASANIGNNLTVGNLLTVGASANIGVNLTVGASANIGNNLTIGNLLTVGANANIGGNLSIGNTATIGTNLTVGNNAQIGGNLNVTGLITTSALNANTVSTTTIQPQAISLGNSVSSVTPEVVATNPSNSIYFYSNNTATITTTVSNEAVYVWGSIEGFVTYDSANAPQVFLFGAQIARFDTSNVATTIADPTISITTLSNGSGLVQGEPFNFIGYLDVISTPGTYDYRLGLGKFTTDANVVVTQLSMVDRTLLIQSLKR
jgi:UDP-3-O-[3-hydroxymyristoyl] glucosamine N-acyltransferase